MKISSCNLFRTSLTFLSLSFTFITFQRVSVTVKIKVIAELVDLCVEWDHTTYTLPAKNVHTLLILYIISCIYECV